MIKFLMIVITTFLCFGLAGCIPKQNKISNDTEPYTSNAKPENKSTNTKKAEYHKISADEAKKMLDNDTGIILLDVRTEAEYKDRHIDEAILIPDYEIEEKAESMLPDKESIILIYCRSGNRSKTAANKLVRMGYTGIYDFGGIEDWTYDTVDIPKKS